MKKEGFSVCNGFDVSKSRSVVESLSIRGTCLIESDLIGVTLADCNVHRLEVLERSAISIRRCEVGVLGSSNGPCLVIGSGSDVALDPDCILNSRVLLNLQNTLRIMPSCGVMVPGNGPRLTLQWTSSNEHPRVEVTVHLHLTREPRPSVECQVAPLGTRSSQFCLSNCIVSDVAVKIDLVASCDAWSSPNVVLEGILFDPANSKCDERSCTASIASGGRTVTVSVDVSGIVRVVEGPPALGMKKRRRSHPLCKSLTSDPSTLKKQLNEQLLACHPDKTGDHSVEANSRFVELLKQRRLILKGVSS